MKLLNNLKSIYKQISTNLLNMCPEFNYKAIYNKNLKYIYVYTFSKYIYFSYLALKNHFNFNFKSIFEFTASGFQVTNSLKLIYIVNFISFRKYLFYFISNNEI